ncbi:response regulator [Chelatococcus sambhunathii]|uniref:histidine kinase n=1 Tax=Chelatococcus sambhunathii TaxID=363953 RepID=A0ABU1DIF6_9HYPH|nr:ATP-binding protein [Chelatococcus sambhunathii]MDR4307893.1 response regulator [Chelatococcus sambhunathii]
MRLTPPRSGALARSLIGAVLTLVCAALAASGLLGQLLGLGAWSGSDPQRMKVNVAIALLAGCGGWLAIQSRRRAARVAGYCAAAGMIAIAGATLLEHLLGVDLHIDTLAAPDLSVPVTGRPGRASVATSASLLLAGFAILLTRVRSERAGDLRQFARLTGLAIPLFAIALYAFDPNALNVIDGFEPTPISTSVALACLLLAMGVDRRSASLRWNVAFIGVFVMAPLVALTVRFASAERETALAAAGERLATVTRLVAERQNSVIEQTRQMLNFLARSEAVRTSSRSCEWELAEYAPVNSWVRALYTVDADGVVRCADRPPSVSIYVGDRDYVKQAFDTRRFTISGFIFARVTGEPRIAIAQPVMDSGARMLVVASIDVEALAGSIDGFGGDLVGGETVTLVDKAGLVIARRPTRGAQAGANLSDATFVSEALAAPGRTYEASDIDGRASLFHARQVLEGTATLIVGAAKHDVVRPVDVRLNRQLQLIVAILFVSLALGVIGSETLVVRPLKRLIDYARRLEAGDFAARPDLRGTAELGALGRALSVSAAAIADRERRLVEAEALFRGLFDHSPDAKAVVRVHPQGQFAIEAWNPAAVRASGLSTEAVIGRAPSEVFPGATGEIVEADMRRALAHGSVLAVERHPSVKRSASVYEIVHVPLRGPDGRIERIFLSARDISERKRVERLKNEFVSTVSHELRTPLTSIAGSLGLLSGGAAGALSERAKHLVSIAHSNSLRLVRLINEILDIEKIEAGRMTFDLKSLAVRDVVLRAIGDLRSYADDFDVRIELDDGGEGLMVYGDEDRLTQVMINLLSNAVKFSPRGETVVVGVSAEGEAASIRVADRGAGVPESFRARMFTKFAQADGSDNRSKGGTGLGLAIVREIVERHAGAVSYRTELGHGTEFEVRLPRHLVRERGVAAFGTVERRSDPKILVCEDDALVAAILAEQMRDAGFEPLTAGTVKAALKLVETHVFAAVLLDLHLPDGSGLGFVQDLRSRPNGKDVPVIVVSASAERGRVDARAEGLGVAAWVAKPVDATRLTRIIRQEIARPASRPCILHVEDDADLCNVVRAALAPVADVTSVGTLAAARRALSETRFDLAILDVALEDGSGLDLVTSLEQEPTPIVVFSALDVDRDAANSDVTLTKARDSVDELVDQVVSLLGDRARTPERRDASQEVSAAT